MAAFRYRTAGSEDTAAIRAVVFAVLREYGLDPDPGGTDADLEDVVGGYLGRGGVFRVLVTPTEEIVGCGGLYPLDGEEAEIRKMYLVPQVRGHGQARILLNDLVSAARERGFQRVVLETASVLEEAISLYVSFGFRPIEREHLASRCDQAYALELSLGCVAAADRASRQTPSVLSR